ncbi:MAG: low molecular weight protein-tyrosine-phosphatase [Parachlamydiaceae bacterium]
MVSVLFVCLGNICRSPAAEGILRHINEQLPQPLPLHVESCGLGSWHVGKLPHEEMRQAAEERGFYLISRAQQLKTSFLDQFDYILAADHEVLNELRQHASTLDQQTKIHLITEYSTLYRDEEIPDPFYQGRAAFDRVLDMLEESCQGFLLHLKSK